MQKKDDWLRALRTRRDELVAQIEDKKGELNEIETGIGFLESAPAWPKVVKVVPVKPVARAKEDVWAPREDTEHRILGLFKPGKEIRRCEIAHAINQTDRRISEYRTSEHYVQKYIDVLIKKDYIKLARKGHYVLVEGSIEELF